MIRSYIAATDSEFAIRRSDATNDAIYRKRYAVGPGFERPSRIEVKEVRISQPHPPQAVPLPQRGREMHPLPFGEGGGEADGCRRPSPSQVFGLCDSLLSRTPFQKTIINCFLFTNRFRCTIRLGWSFFIYTTRQL